jgi:NitT/TauT family transport system substrate-binding protein
MRGLPQICAALIATFAVSAPLRAEVAEIKITKQPGVNYLPMVIMEHNKLVEKHAKAAGLPDLKASWMTFKSGGAATDALLAGSVDMVTSGGTNLLLLWAKTNGEVKGVSGTAATPMILVTRNPAVKSIKDFTAADKIAVPTVKVSTQAIVLQMAAEKTFGQKESGKLDPMTVSMGHPDAVIALGSGKGEVNSHFSLLPYSTAELKMPGIKQVLSSVDVLGGPASNGVVFTTTKFHDANPKVVAAFNKALAEAIDLVNKDKAAAAKIYIEATKEKMTQDELVSILKDKNVVYSLTPYGTMKFADYMHRAGLIKTKPGNWKEVYFPAVHKLNGN